MFSKNAIIISFQASAIRWDHSQNITMLLDSYAINVNRISTKFYFVIDEEVGLSHNLLESG